MRSSGLSAGRDRYFPEVWLPAKTCCGGGEPRGRLLRWISAAPRSSGRRTGS
jgi:hypothetical protein